MPEIPRGNLTAGDAECFYADTFCAAHGAQRHVVAVLPGQDPWENATTPPVCSMCEHIDEPQATVTSLTDLFGWPAGWTDEDRKAVFL